MKKNKYKILWRREYRGSDIITGYLFGKPVARIECNAYDSNHGGNEYYLYNTLFKFQEPYDYCDFNDSLSDLKIYVECVVNKELLLLKNKL